MNFNNRFKISINIVHIFAAFILILCIDNVYVINTAFRYTSYFYALRIVFCLFTLALYLTKKYVPSKITTIILIFYGFVFLSTIYSNGNIMTAIKVYSRPLTIILFVDIFWKKRKQFFSVWIIMLFILVVLDGMSMILYPNGMYNTVTFDMYTLNWFLGYKTARYEYSMPLCVLIGYLSYLRNNRIGKGAIIVFIICGFELFYSEAMGAFLSIIIIGGCCLIDNTFNVFLNRKFPIYRFLKGKIIVFTYLIIVLSVFFLERIAIMRFIVENVLKKSTDLTGRTYIWDKCLEIIRRNPIWGNGYFAYEDYVEVTGYVQMGSAHSLLLNILVCSGIVGLIIYLKIILTSFDTCKFISRGSQYILGVSIVSYLIIGIVSDSMFTAFFGFPLFQLLFLELNNSDNDIISVVNNK